MRSCNATWIARVRHSDLTTRLRRKTPLAEVKKKAESMSIFIVDLKHASGNGLTVRPDPDLVNHETNEPSFEDLENLIGGEARA